MFSQTKIQHLLSRTWLSLLTLFVPAGVFAANPSYSSFDGTQFVTNGPGTPISVKPNAPVTNLNVRTTDGSDLALFSNGQISFVPPLSADNSTIVTDGSGNMQLTGVLANFLTAAGVHSLDANGLTISGVLTIDLNGNYLGNVLSPSGNFASLIATNINDGYGNNVIEASPDGSGAVYVGQLFGGLLVQGNDISCLTAHFASTATAGAFTVNDGGSDGGSFGNCNLDVKCSGTSLFHVTCPGFDGKGIIEAVDDGSGHHSHFAGDGIGLTNLVAAIQSGATNVTGGDMTVDIGFVTPYADANYHVFATVNSVINQPSFTVSVNNRTATGFTINWSSGFGALAKIEWTATHYTQ